MDLAQVEYRQEFAEHQLQLLKRELPEVLVLFLLLAPSYSVFAVSLTSLLFLMF